MLKYPGKAGGPNHTAACRRGIMEKLKTTVEGRRRIELTERRHLDNEETRMARKHCDQTAGRVPEVPEAGTKSDSREERLDNSEGPAQVRHEDEENGMEEPDADEPRMELDLAEELCEDGEPEGLADMTRELLHLAL